MARKKSLLNVKEYIEWVNHVLEDIEKYSTIPPVYVTELHKINLIGRAILKKHSEKKTRKDIYVGSSHNPERD